MQFYFHQHIQYFTNACVISQNMHFFIFYALFRKKIIHNFFLEFSHKKLITFSSREFSDFSSDPIKLSQRTEHHNRKLRFYCHNKFFQLTIFSFCKPTSVENFSNENFSNFHAVREREEKNVRENVMRTTTMHVMWVNE